MPWGVRWGRKSFFLFDEHGNSPPHKTDVRLVFGNLALPCEYFILILWASPALPPKLMKLPAEAPFNFYGGRSVEKVGVAFMFSWCSDISRRKTRKVLGQWQILGVFAAVVQSPPHAPFPTPQRWQVDTRGLGGGPLIYLQVRN